jgi:UDP-N-acetylglucosamine diphosphorylase / glucose-1-phosphate thymidylyltransferase / UDP-N-acetylgalactosamine diphosphorylase / glucosamine-1-phosphate N-acetyltransferase / galactosamine-1-phosphate N-acetyltransferase
MTMPSAIPRTAVVLAAGRGRKIWPFATVRNKCAFPIANVPVVRRLADALLAAGVEQLVVVVGHQAGSVRAALAGLEERVQFVSQAAPEGTAPAVLAAAEAAPDEDLLVLYGDVVTAPESLAAFARRFAAERPAAAALLQPLGEEPPGSWLTASVSDERVSGIQGHGRGGSHRLCGVYAFRREALAYLRRHPGLMTHVPVGGMPAPEAELAESVAQMADDGETVMAVPCEGYFVDLDKPWHILEANERVLADEGERLTEDRIAEGCEVSDDAEIHGHLVMAPGSRIGRRVVVRGNLWLGPGASVTNGAIVGGNTAIGRDSRVRDYALLGGGSAVGARAILGHGAEFGGVLLDGAYLYHYCEIDGVLGCAVDIGAATVCGTLRFDDGDAPHVIAGRRETPRHGANASFLGDYSRTGVNAILMPGVKVGVYSCVGPGVILYEDLPERQLILAKQELIVKEWGPERYGW